MVNKQIQHRTSSYVSKIEFFGSDANVVYTLLERIYKRLEDVKCDCYSELRPGTLVFLDEIKVLDQLFQ